METEERHDPGIGRDGALRFSIYGLFALGVLYTLYLARGVVLPITLAVLTSLLFGPVVRRLARHRVPPAVSALLLLVLLVAALAGTGWLVAKPALNWLERAPEGLQQLLHRGNGLQRELGKVTHSAEEVSKTVKKLTEQGKQPATVVLQSQSWKAQFLVNARDAAAAVALGLALSFFLLVNGDRLIHNFVRQLPDRARRRTMLRAVRESQRETARYLAVVTASNSMVGLITALMAWALGMPSPAVWGALAALLRFVPYLGVLITVALLAVVAAVSLNQPLAMAAAPAGYIVLTAVVGFFLEPYIHGFRMSVNPVVIFLGIFFWGWLWGAIGVFVAVPLLTVIQVVLHRIETLKPVYRVIAR